MSVLIYPKEYKVYMALDKDPLQYNHFFLIKRTDEYDFEKVLMDHKIDYILYMSATKPCFIAFKSEQDLTAAKLLY